MIRRLSIAACIVEIQAAREIQILPAGEFRANDGRPKGPPAWRLNATLAQALIARVAARANRLVIDYEHQSINAASNGQPAPAAGWFKRLEWREPLKHADGSIARAGGLWAVDVEWTERAKAAIEAHEYLYLSPVFAYDAKTGDVRDLLNAGLTNTPALDGMEDLAARAAARLQHDDFDPQHDDTDKEMSMDFLKKLCAALGLEASGTEEQALTAVAALTAAGDRIGALEAQLAAAKSQTPDPAKFVPVETVTALQGQVAALTSRINGAELDDLVQAGLSDGRILPEMEAWARELGGKDVAALKTYLDKAQPIAALRGTQTGGKAPAGGSSNSALNEAELAVCKALGLKAEDYSKSRVAA